MESYKRKNKTKKIEIRVSEDELKRINHIAKMKNMNRSDYIRSCIFIKQKGKRAEVKVIYALTKLQEILNNAAVWSKTYLEKEIAEIWTLLLK